MMPPLEDCDFRCECGRVCCGDNGDDCGCTDVPTCIDCCERDHDQEARNVAPLTEAEREVLYADGLALDNLHAEWARTVLEGAIIRILAGRATHDQEARNAR